MKLYLDDVRNPDQTYRDAGWWAVIRTPEAFVIALKMKWDEVTHISLDNDLGEGKAEGRQVLDIIETMCDGIHPHFEILIHSANPVARKAMNLTIKRMKERRDAQA